MLNVLEQIMQGNLFKERQRNFTLIMALGMNLVVGTHPNKMG
jgi:hypothetical protein